jgi:branched-chain amino acid transport system ATP-binding protein
VSFLRVEGVTRVFGGLAAVNDVSLEVRQGEIMALIGPNGAGKTTLFNVLSGFHAPTKGRVFFKDEDVSGLAPHILARRGIARTFQIVKPLRRLSVFDNVMVSAFLRAGSRDEAALLSRETLALAGLWPDRETLAQGLPLGKRKRLEIARALATRADLLLLDESFAGLNPTELDECIAIVRKIRDRGLTIMIIEHHMKVIMALSDRITVLNHGEKIAEGTPTQIRSDRKVVEAYLGESADA